MAIDNYIAVIVILCLFAFVTVKAGKLTVAGAFLAVITGFLVFAGDEYTGLSMLVVFFVLGTLATSWKKKDKLPYKAYTDRSAKRDACQVLANGGVAAICGVMVLIVPSYTYIFRLMMAAALASATADTLSSELGMVYGKHFFNIITFRKEAKGLDGVISLEGTLIGIMGSAIIAAIAVEGHIRDRIFLWIIVAGTLGNIADSVIGALFERKHYISNNWVNLFNTLLAALIMYGVLTLLLHYGTITSCIRTTSLTK